MLKKPPVLLFRNRRIQGRYFHLTSVTWSRNALPRYHSHDYPEVFWLTDGTCVHRVNGQVMTLQRGALVLMRASDHHSLAPTRTRRFAFTNLAIEADFWQSLYDRFGDSLAALYDPARPLPWTTQLGPRDLDAVMEDARQLAGQPHQPFHLERFLLNTWHRCLANTIESSGPTQAPDWLREACVQIQELDVCRGGVPAFAELCGRSPEYVSRMCRKHYDQTPSQLVNQARLRTAASLLRTTTRSVTDIALDCGFEAPARFYAIFKAAYRTTPRRYRQAR